MGSIGAKRAGGLMSNVPSESTESTGAVVITRADGDYVRYASGIESKVMDNSAVPNVQYSMYNSLFSSEEALLNRISTAGDERFRVILASTQDEGARGSVTYRDLRDGSQYSILWRREQDSPGGQYIRVTQWTQTIKPRTSSSAPTARTSSATTTRTSSTTRVPSFVSRSSDPETSVTRSGSSTYLDLGRSDVTAAHIRALERAGWKRRGSRDDTWYK